MLRELDGQVALVTGATRNIGRAIAEDLAGGGAAVAVAGHSNAEAARDVVDAIMAQGGRAFAVLGDVRDPQSVAQMAAQTRGTLGPISILVNCAAVREETPFADIQLADWQRILSIVLDGAFNLAQAVLPDMQAAGGGTIINIGGETGHTGARERAHVVTAKAGLAGFTKALALDLAGDGITVNCVVPGTINTESSAMRRHAGSQFKQKRMPPLGRRGEPWEIAAMVRMLCGPGARYITGQSVHVNGGHSCP
ncbi:3-oxoacyl-[acyl-carrier protein] reductase [Ancylobacter aquaticus]|uniref:3-oxoacyl-[acyl-carrier protein] reductase n=1 Tax=Ancylobacter aquaticus TaxID=100 RepID=A0A4V2PJZ3_ANCAQ|nr:3-oxoacyl-ACP reductase FabG [Ancylobacter aquaticus]TCK30406.1 3-oxoacyl-[acyl-carrier protein] reductase [Ancylobacter aquaticus]